MTRARRDLRWREQAARLIVEACWPRVHRWTECSRCDGNKSTRCLYCGGSGRRIVELSRYVQIGQHFDVAEVRAYCERLISEADALDLQRAVFADWTRARGMGPEEPDRGRFVPDYWLFTVTSIGSMVTSLDIEGRRGCWWRVEVDPVSLRGAVSTLESMRLPQHCHMRIVDGVLHIVAMHVRLGLDSPAEDLAVVATGERPNIGGWPGSLAREYAATQRARRRCSRRDCDGGVLTGDFVKHMSAAAEAGVSMTITATDDGCGVACPECERFAATRTPRTFANGGTLRRAAKRLLDTLDGRCPWAPDAEAQASECTHCCYAVTHDAEGRAWATRGRGWVDAGVLRSDVNAPLDHVPGTHVRLRECPACSGTGHNLRGTLPPLPADTVERLTGRRPMSEVLREHFTADDFDRMLGDLQAEE